MAEAYTREWLTERAEYCDGVGSANIHLKEIGRLCRALLDAREDRERLDWLDAALKDEAGWDDLVLCHDWEDGAWLARLERGSFRSSPLKPFSGRADNVRAAIDAARQPESTTAGRRSEGGE